MPAPVIAPAGTPALAPASVPIPAAEALRPEGPEPGSAPRTADAATESPAPKAD
jgi:hypothetical protein